MVRSLLATALATALLVGAASAVSSCPDFIPRSEGDPANSNIKKVESIYAGVFKFTGTRSAPRIVGGSLSDLTTDMPNHLVRVNTGGICSGSVVNKRYVLTAAHCEGGGSGAHILFFDPVAKTWTTRRNIARQIVHPEYNTRTLQNDIMLIELTADAPESALAVVLNRKAGIPRGMAVTRVAGFGVTVFGGALDLQLRQVDVPARGKNSCISLVGGYDHASMICAGYKCGGCDACQGDSGGPQFQFTDTGMLYQVGVVSFGVGCAYPQNPGGYARVSPHIAWIKATVGAYGVYQGGNVQQVRLKGNSCPS